MNRLIPLSSQSTLRVFASCLLSFLIFMTPLASLAASIKSTASPDARSPRQETAATKTQVKTSNAPQLSPTSFFNLLSTQAAPVATASKNNLPGIFSSLMPAAPVITASKVDSFATGDDVDNDGAADPGDKITYNVTISNIGSADAAAVSFSDTVHPHTTFLSATLNASPLAFDDHYDTIANTLLEVGPVASPSSNPKITVTGNVLSNDVDFLGDSATPPTLKAPLPTTSAHGTVSMDANGHFSYTPDAGFTGDDTFNYTITDDGADGIAGNADDLTNTGKVTITVSAQRVWYVQNTAAPGGLGRSSDPFDTLAEAQAAATTAGDTIYVFTGNGTTSGQNSGYTIQANNQRLLGEGVQLDVPVSVNGGPNPTVLRPAGTAPHIGNSGGNGVTMGNLSGISIRGLNIAGSTNGIGVTFSAAGGGVTISNNTLSGTSQNAIDVTTTTTTVGGGSVTIGSNTITGAGVEGIDINASGTGTLIADVQNNSLTATGNGFDARTTAGALQLNFSNNPGIVSGGNGVDISGLGGGALTITGFANNSVSGASGANGISIHTATFDSNPGVGGLQALTAGTLAIGASGVGNGVGGNGLVLINTTGTLPFTTLNVFSDNGRGIDVTGLGAATTGLTAGSGATISATNGAAIFINGTTIDLQNTLITSSNSSDNGVMLGVGSGVNGTFSAVASSSITSAAGDDFAVGSGTANITWNAPLSNSGSGNSVDVSGHTGGTVAFTGTIGDTGQGINLNSNTGATINFTGVLTLTTTTNAAFTATGAGPLATSGGTVTATATTNVITTTTGVGLNVAHTTIGSGGLKFKSITVGTAASGPATSGIILNNTGTSGSLVVSGNGNASLGGDDSGGIIQKATQYGISLTSTLSPSFTNMNIHDIGRNGIDGFKVTNFTFANGKISTCGTASMAGDFEVNNIAFVDRSGANDNTLDGTVSITNSTITDPERNAIYIETWAGTISSLNISNNTISGGTTNARILNAIGVFSQGSASGTGSITTATIQNNNISDFRFFDTAPAIDVWIGGNGIRMVGGNPNAASTSATLGTVANPIVISGNDIDNVGSNMIAVTFAGKQGISNFTIQNNGTNADKMTNAEGNGISVFFGGNGTFNALVDNNWIDGIDQGGNPSGSKGIAVQSDFGLVQNSDVTNSNITVSNNTVSNTAGDGIQATGINNAGTFNVRVVNNNVTTVPDLDARYGIRVQQSNVGTQPTLNLEINGNTTQGAFNAFHVLGNGIGIRKQDPYQFGIEGLTPTPTNSPEAYINSQNPAGHGTDKLAGTGFIAQNVALYKPENNQQQYTARGDSELQNSNGLVNSLLAYLNINPNFASTPADTTQTAQPASSETQVNAAKPSQAMARGNFLDSMLALMKENSQTTSPTVNHNDSESSETSVASLYADASSHTNDQPVDASLVAASAPSSKSNNSVALSHASTQSAKGIKASASKGRNAAQLGHAARTRASATAATLMPSGELVSVTIGALPQGKIVTIQFKVQLDAPPNLAPADLVGGAHVSNQGTVHYTGEPVGGVLTDDPTPGGTTDPTNTPVDLYDSQTTVISSNNNSSQGESITFTATVVQNQTLPPSVPGGTDPTGTVQFFDGANPITCDENGGNSTQPLSSGTATCTTSGLTPGANKTIKAQYNGDGNFETSFGTTLQTVIACSLNPVVTSTLDSGPNTLRDAVTNICLAPNNNVTFNLGAGAHTITLLSELPIAKSVTISNTVSGTNGPLTISGGGTTRLFNIASTASVVGLSNLTLANGSAVTGGAILNDSSTLTIYNSTLSGNVASTDGGAIANIGTGTLTITNSTISGNRASNNGGGIHSLGTATLKNVTVTDNHSDNDNNTSGAGGGINVAGGTFTIHNTIVAGNFKGSGTTTADDVNNNLNGSSSFNIIGVGGGLTNGSNGNQTGVSVSSLRLGALASNGGPTQTHALLAGSPALDAGDNSLVTGPPFSGPPFTDQRGTGYGRIRDAADADTTQTVDIGAFEADPSVEDITNKTTTEDTAVPTFSFNVGDAASAFDSITATSGNTTLVPNANLVITGSGSSRNLAITPAANQSGTATITVTVTKTINSNPVSMSDTFDVIVSEVNDAPIAGNDALSSVAEDSGQRIILFSTLLTNDSPPATENTQTISIISVSNAVGGTPTIDIPNSRVLFTPTADFNGSAHFDYTIEDNGTTNGASDPKTATATVSFTVTEVNDVPVPATDTLTPVAEDSGQTIIPFSAVTSNDNKGAANESAQTLTVSSISNTVGGTFILDTVNSRVLFTPSADFNGTASFDYKVTDNGTTNSVSDPKTSVGSATASIPVTEVNDAPTAVGENISSIAEDSGQRIILYSDILGNDIKGPANESGQTLVVKTISSPVGGTVTNDPANSRVLFTPTADFNGAASFQYTVEDNGTTNGANDFKTSANTVTTSFTITEVNDTPVVVNDTLTSVAEDSGQRIIPFSDLTTNDDRGAANESGQTLVVKTISNFVGGTATLDTPNSRVLFTPAANFNGTASFDYTVQDNGTTAGSSDPKTSAAGKASFTVTPIADTPTVSNASTAINTQTTSGLVITPNAADGAEVTHFKITNIQNGTLFQADGSTPINNGDFITVAQGGAGLKFTPGNNLTSPSSTFGFDVQASTSNTNAGLGGSTVTASITVTCQSGLVVTSLLDDGAVGTLRHAINFSCPGSTVTFNLGAGPHTITLTAGQLIINKDLTITGSDASSPVTIGGGGASRVFSITAGNVNISNLTISGGQVAGDGAGLSNSGTGTLTITNSTFTGNAATNGGAIATIAGTVNIYNTTISGNTVTGDGGGLYHNTAGTVNVLNSTIYNNHADTGQGGGIASPGGTTNVRNSIVAGNTAVTNANVSGTITDQGNNILSGDPKVAALASNGGPTQTHALLPGSPALDTGDNTSATNAGLTTDQRGTGFARIRDAASDADTTQTVDIGAFEADPSVEDITDKATAEDTALPSFSFNVGDSASAFTSITATSSDTTLVPNANIIISGSGSTRSLSITPAANKSGTTTITVTVTKTIGGTAVSMSDTFVLTVGTVPDTPTATNATTNEDTQTTSGLLLDRNAADGSEVTHFKITGITGGALFQNNGSTPINNGDFITVAQGQAGLKFSPTPNTFGSGQFQVQASTDAVGTVLSAGSATATITINAIADTPSVTNATTNEDTQTASGLVISRNAADGAEVTHFKITGITNGTLFKSNGTTQINNGDVITFAEGQAGLKFTPAANLFSPSTTFSFQAQGATSAAGGGLSSGFATATITVNTVADTPSVTNATTNEDTQTSTGLVITRNPADGAEVTHFKITGITGGTLFQNNGTTVINNNDFITVAQGGAGLKFTPTANSNVNGQFQVQASLNNTNGGLGGGLATATITVNPVNDAPTLDAIGNVTINEDAPAQTVNLTGISAGGGESQTLVVTATSNNTGLIPNPTVTYTSPNATGSIQFTPVANQSGSALITVTVNDGGGTANGGTETVTRTFTVTVNAVNDAPVNTVPGAQNATRNTDFTFSAANSNLISISDVDAGAATVKVTLIATNGKLTLSGTAGLTFTPPSSNNDGVNDAQLIFTGTIASINAALNGLVFSPTPGYDGPASIQIITDDQGNTGSGGAQTDNDTINITVNKGGLIAFSSATYTVAESGATATITVNRTGGSSGTTKVDYATSNGTATAGQDYTAASGQLTFGNGEITKTFTVPILEDALNEAPETINLTLSNAQGSGDLGPQSTAVLTITDNDPTPSLSINDVTVTEGNSGTVNATFTVTLSAISGQQVTVNYQTADGTATAPSDYTAIPSTLLTFNPGETTKTVTVLVKGDVLAEVDETFFVNLSGATNATISDNQGVGNIVSDDTPVIQFSASTYSVDEDGLRATITVNRLGDISKVARIDYATSDPSGLTNCSVVTGNASSRCDYATSVGTVRFAANEGSRTISIPIVNDVYVEGPESFTITLSNPVGGDLGTPSTATITINDNDNGGAPNPIDNNAFFIRQLYIDFLGREPDPPGLAGWLSILNNCPSGDQSCDRVHIAEGFARSVEFQERGYFIYRVYRASLGRKPNYAEFIPDMAKVSGFLNGPDLEANKQAFIQEFMTRTEFSGKYAALDNIGYVNALEQTSLVVLPNKQALINDLNAGTKTKAEVLRAVIETPEVYAKNVNEAFVVMEYFGFLRRDPDAAYLVWIDQFNHSNDYRAVIKGFVNSLEYRFRFGP